MNDDFRNRMFETARAMQQTVTDAVAKGTEQAKPLIAEAVGKAQELQRTLAEQAPAAGGAAQTQLQAAQAQLGTFISAGREALGKSVEGAGAGLAPLAKNARAAIHVAAKAVSEVTAPKPPTRPPG